MALYVQKFGGTSLGSIDRIRQIAYNIAQAYQAGHRIVVVVSAMAGETQRLLMLAEAISQPIDEREYAVLLSTGEQVSIALVTMALKALGYHAKSFTGQQAGIHTNNACRGARIDEIDVTPLQQSLDGGCIPVVAGFQGVNAQREISTLGRGGSDTTAVAIAAALKADECQIFTDVDGVYTADPRIVPTARRLAHITFEEMLELASLGAKVLQSRAVEFAGKYHVPLRVLSSFLTSPSEGTLISYEDNPVEKAAISGITYNRSEAKLTLRGVPNKPGVASHILGPISDFGIGIDMIIQNAASTDTTDFTFTVHRDDYPQALAILQQAAKDLGAAEVSGDLAIAKLSIVGVGMRSHAGIASTIFDALGAKGINICLISTSEIKVSVVVDEKYLEAGVCALHTAFGLGGDAVEEYDPFTTLQELKSTTQV